jgi:hypothetical protein
MRRFNVPEMIQALTDNFSRLTVYDQREAKVFIDKSKNEESFDNQEVQEIKNLYDGL